MISATEKVLVLDNGAGDVKAGFAGEGEPSFVVPNRTATLPKQLRTFVADETVSIVKSAWHIYLYDDPSSSPRPLQLS